MTLLLSFIGIAGSARPETQGSEQANCFVESGVDTVVVASMAALETAINAAPPGRQILIAPGTYAGGTRTFNRDGTEANPIVIRPQNGLGTVTINNAAWTIADTSSWLVFSKVYFEGGQIIVRGDHNRITRCRTRNFNFRCETVRDCRLDHLDCAEGRTPIDYRGAGSYGTGAAARLLIDHCYLHDLTGDTTQVITGFGDIAVPALGSDVERGQSITFDHCLIENISHNGEFIVNKVGGMIWRFCTFLDCGGEFEMRNSAHYEIRSCWFQNIDTNVKAWADDNIVIGNRFVGGINLWAPCGSNTWEFRVANNTTDYAPATNSSFIGNRFGSGHLQLGAYWNNGPDPTVPANNNLLEANTRDSGGAVHELLNGSVGEPLDPGSTNTTINATTSVQYTPAVKLTAADVGLNAPDPLCG